jgi:hypothetical protein
VAAVEVEFKFCPGPDAEKSGHWVYHMPP